MKKSIFIVLFIALFVFCGCDMETSTQGIEMKKQEETQKSLTESVPVPKITKSTTREALSKRAQLFDANNKITYIYLINYGKVMAFFTVQGQAVSLRSYLTPMETIVDYNGNVCSGDSYNNCYSAGYGGIVVQAPDLDGTYGDNPDGIFFFTTEGAYVEWKGDYMVSDQPLKLTQQPELIREIE
jgi:hypothetical protein